MKIERNKENNGNIENLAGEINLLTREIEKQGVEDMLKNMSEEEISSMPDPNMPLRHFRAEKGELDAAICKIKKTLAWRKEFEVDKILRCFNEDGDNEMRKIIEKENETGKLYVRGFDKEGRAALYMHPSLENTKNPKNNMRHLVYNLERAIACTAAKSGLEKINIMIDYEHFKVWNAPSASTTQWTLSILQDHYPERLYKGYVLNPGLFFGTVLTLIRPFLDPVTREKIVNCGSNSAVAKVGERFDLNDVEKCAGGDENEIRPFNSSDYLTKIPFEQSFI